MNKDLALYLKSKQGLSRLLDKLKEKYISLNRYSGSIKLSNITKEESIDIGNLLGRKIEEGTILTTSFKEITRKIEEGKYHGFDWEELFHHYFKGSIISKKEKKELDSKNEEEFFKELITDNQNRKYIKEITHLLEHQTETMKTMHQKYHRNPEELKKDFSNILLLLDSLPASPTSLPVFSSITGNPHYLDLNRSTSNLFFKVLSEIEQVEYPQNTQDKVNLLSEINVYTDPISNFVITYGLTGNDILERLKREKQVLNLNLLNIDSMENIDTKEKKVFVFENPSILNALMGLEVPMVITSGIPNLAFYRLIEKLNQNGNEIYYNGDFDPEGAMIADKLVKKYPNIRVFCYEKIDYEQAKSKEIITDSRLKKLESVDVTELQEIKRLLLEHRVAAYQERNMNRLKEFIERTMERK